MAGIPGRREDYPMFDAISGRRIHANETLPSPGDRVCEYLGLSGYKVCVGVGVGVWCVCVCGVCVCVIAW